MSEWTLLGTETRGANEKVWLRDDLSSERWLFKPRSQHSNGSAQVGDWVEWASAEVASALGVPSATIQLGERDGDYGCLSRHVAPSKLWEIHSGRLWLDDHPDATYSSAAATPSRRVRGASPGHSLDNVRNALEGLVAPPTCDADLTAWDVFVGYLTLDALTSNRDRHEENWSIMRPLRGSTALAPTYDMENGLGFQLRDEKRSACLEDPEKLDLFARRGTAYRFEGVQHESLVDVAASSAASCSESGRRWLRGLIDTAETLDFSTLLRPASGVSEVAVRFAQVLLGRNVRRMQDAYSD